MQYEPLWSPTQTYGGGWNRWRIMTNEVNNYKLRILYEVDIAKWRVGDQRDPENRQWCLYVFDKNQEEWVAVNTLKDAGEGASIKHMQIVEE